MVKRKRRNTNLQNITHKTKDRVALKIRGELMCSGRVSSFYNHTVNYKQEKIKMFSILGSIASD